MLQPGEERRRTGSHYTPRWLSEKVVQRTLEPILACLGEDRTPEQILSLKICDPAMGSGAFLVAACRLLAEDLVAAWDRAGEAAAITEQHGDAHLHARRLIAQRCLYGVDKNAAAVELAKLSLWLVTLSKELPFTFVDHALRHGDSLVGLDLDQIKSFHWQPKDQLETCRRALDDALEQALEHRDLILDLATKEDPVSQREKTRLLEYAEQATARIRMIADVCVGAFFAEDKPKAREKERVRRLDLVQRLLDGDDEVRPELEQMAAEIRGRHAPFHWMIEFPEVFYLERPDPLQPARSSRVAFMEAFVGNPPFITGTRISTVHGNSYRDWVLSACPAAHGNADLAVHFLQRAFSLLGDDGAVGLLATATIAQGDSRSSGLAVLLGDGIVIYDATSAQDWPGAASVQFCSVCLATPRVAPEARRLDEQMVAHINSQLKAGPERPPMVQLVSNARLASKGVDTGGAGFVLTAAEAERLLDQHGCARRYLRPYIGGQELNNSPTYEHERFVIDFTGKPLSEATRCEPLLSIVRERVLPSRQALRSTPVNDRLKEAWWLFWAPREGFMQKLASLPRFLATTVYTKHLAFSFQTAARCYNSKILLIAVAGYTGFGVLQSRIHETWARHASSTLGDTLNYAVSDALYTFAFPEREPDARLAAVSKPAQELYDSRSTFMQTFGLGLTETYNALKDPANDDPRIVELRRLHEQVDRTVLDAYGWPDIPVPPFCPKSDEDRAAVQSFEDEVIDRLYLLNAERAREEERLGLGKKKGKKGKKASKSEHARGDGNRQGTLDFE